MRLSDLAARYRLPPSAGDQLDRLLAALAAEPDPQTSIPPEQWPEAHVADSLAGLEVEALRAATGIADLGAGAGFPGLPLAIALPDARVDLIEASRRKAALIERLARAGSIGNAKVVPARAEDWARGDGRGTYDAVCARAVGPLAVLVEYAAPLLSLDGVLVAWKGAPDAEEERSGARAAAEVGLEPAGIRYVEPYPGSRQRHLHLYRKVRETADRFPRRTGVAAKRPLG